MSLSDRLSKRSTQSQESKRRQLQSGSEVYGRMGGEAAYGAKSCRDCTRLVAIDIKFPYKVDNRDYTLLGMYNSAIYSVIDLTGAKTPDLMLWLEKHFGKEITTRTWKTVERIRNVMRPLAQVSTTSHRVHRDL